MTASLETPPLVKAKAGYAKVLVLGFLVLLCYAPALKSLVREWMTNEDMGHGFFVPLVVGYIVWQQRQEIEALPAQTDWRGLILVLLGGVQCILATLGVELFLSRSAVIVTLAGIIWTVGGSIWFKKLAFPLFLLCFMVPLPAVIFNSLTFPLQVLASQLAAAALSVLQIPVLREGNILQLPSGPLSVVEACSGIRSLLSLTFLSLVYGYFFEKNQRLRVVLFFSTIPIAIIANGGRVTITGVLSEINPEFAKGFFHESTGWVIFMLALAILLLFHRILLAAGRFQAKMRTAKA
jgi:exosortase